MGSLTQVNQKLAYARALFKQCWREADSQSVNRRLTSQALLDGAVFHLLCAYRHYLRELAETYAVPEAGQILTEADLVEALENLGKNPAEARELLALRWDSDSWLTGLQTAYNACWETPEPEANRHRIKVLDLEAPEGRPGQVTTERLQRWLEAFEELTERQRETSAEY